MTQPAHSDIFAAAALAWTPSDTRPCWQWCEDNILLDATAPVQGKYSTTLTPMIRWFYGAAQDPRTRYLVVMVSAQSAKTQGLLNFLSWCVKNSPAPAMWVMATQENAKEFVKKRLRVGLEHCSAIRDLMPSKRGRDALNLIQFSGMNLIVRGSNSRVGLQSDPVRRIFCDERREWKPGAIDLLRKRTRTFFNSIEISVGTAGRKDDELHADWMAGSQTFFHWNCLDCGHSQPFRFGKRATTLWEVARPLGGIVWDTNDITKPGGRWNVAEAKKTAAYECEKCGRRYRTPEKFTLLKSMHEHHRNPGALPSKVSLHWNAIYMPWASCSFEEIVGEFLTAQAQAEAGNIEPMKAFVTETLGEPWEDEVQEVEDGELVKRAGAYVVGELWPQAKTQVLILTADVQAGYLVYVVRQHRLGGASRLIEAGKVLDFEELRRVQVKLEIRGNCMGIDSAHNPREVGQACLVNGWIPLLGDDAKDFTRQEIDPETGKLASVKSHWKPVRWDPGIGTSREGAGVVARYSWCNDHYKDQLFLYEITGKSSLWEIPSNAPEDYLKQMNTGYRRVKHIDPTSGAVSWKWKDGLRRDYADCELMQLVMADIGHLKTV